MVVIRDSSLVEDGKRRQAGMETLLADLTGMNGNTAPRRHLNAVISDNPGHFSSELSAFFISLRGCGDVGDLSLLQQRLGEFDRALINHFTNSDERENPVASALRHSCVERSIRNSERAMSLRMLRTTLEILSNYRLINCDDYGEIVNYMKNADRQCLDSEQAICNDFRQVLSECIVHGPLKLVKQFGPPYYDSDECQVIIDARYINFKVAVMDSCILIRMKTTKRRNPTLNALKACGKLHTTNNLKRNIEVETAPGITETVSVYSVPITMLTLECREKINSHAFDDNLFQRRQFPDFFVPMLSIGPSGTAGRIINNDTDEAESLYCSGRTRSGKTYFLLQQALIRAERGDRVIIFDQTGAFDSDRLPAEMADLIAKEFSYWDLHKMGLPIDLLSFEHCSTLPDKKNHLLSVFALAAKINGDVQRKSLRKCLSGIVQAVDAGDIRSLPETLGYFNESDPDQAGILSRLEDVFEDLEGLELHQQNWGEFLDTQKRIVVITTGTDHVQKHSQLIDILLSDLYSYKQHNRESRYTVVIDELEDLCLEKSAPISTILRKGGKHRLSLLMASQEFSTEKDRLGKLIGNCGMLVFFRPKDADISEIASHTGIERETLAHLEQGECVAVGGFYSRTKARNCHAKLKGRTYCETACFHDTTSNTTCQA